MLRFFVLVALFLAVPAHASCELVHPGDCSSTNALMWSAKTDGAIKRFLGKEPGNFLYPTPKSFAFNDAFEVLSGPPERPKRIGKDSWLLTACRAHSCTEKGGMVIVRGKIVAIGILHFNCGKGSGCDDDYTLSLFLSTSPSSEVATSSLKNWARSQIAAEYTYPGMHVAALAHIKTKIRPN
jgi:hypothetical protein